MLTCQAKWNRTRIRTNVTNTRGDRSRRRSPPVFTI